VNTDSPRRSHKSNRPGLHQTQGSSCSLAHSGWAREFYDQQRARGKGHHAALRALGNRWLEVLWHCLHKGCRYDEATHVANRNQALAAITSPAA
jgi:hypothetical protein